MLRILFGIEDIGYFIYFMYALIGVLSIFLFYRKILFKIKFWEKEMDRLYRELWTKVKSESADPDISIIVINSRINKLKKEYSDKIDHLETKRDILLHRIPIVNFIYYRHKKKEERKLIK